MYDEDVEFRLRFDRDFGIGLPSNMGGFTYCYVAWTRYAHLLLHDSEQSFVN